MNRSKKGKKGGATPLFADNRDKSYHKIRIHKGILGSSENLDDPEDRYDKKDVKDPSRAVVKRGSNRKYIRKECIFPFRYTSTDGEEKQSSEPVNGHFRLDDEEVKPKPGSWCATEVDRKGRLREWGYAIPITEKDGFWEKRIERGDLATARRAAQYIMNSFPKRDYATRHDMAVGYLESYSATPEVYDEIMADPVVQETIRNKDQFPDVSGYEPGSVIEVSGKKYKLVSDTTIGRYRWEIVIGSDGVASIPESTRKPIQSISSLGYWGTNREVVPPNTAEYKIGDIVVSNGEYFQLIKPESGVPKWVLITRPSDTSSVKKVDGQIHAYPGIIGFYENKHRRKERTDTKKENRVEMSGQCIFPFYYTNNRGETVLGEGPILNDLRFKGEHTKNIGLWCATEVDNTGYIQEWGYATRNRPDTANEKLISAHDSPVEVIKKLAKLKVPELYNLLCQQFRYEQWDKITTTIDRLIQLNISYETIRTTINQTCGNIEIHNIQRLLFIIKRITLEYIQPQEKKAVSHPESYRIRPDLKDYLIEHIRILHTNFSSLLDTSFIDIDFSERHPRWIALYYFLLEHTLALFLLEIPGKHRDLIQSLKQETDVRKMNLQILDMNQQLQKYFFKKKVLSLERIQKAPLFIINFSSIFAIQNRSDPFYFSAISEFNPENIVLDLLFYNPDFLVKESGQRGGYTPYPLPDRSDFLLDLQRRKEFYDNRMEGYEGKRTEDLCLEREFELAPQQQWVANFFNPDTPYRGLLLFWGTGVGKTCASITIANRHLEHYKKMGRKILVILGSSTRDNYFKELYNYDKEIKEVQKGLPPGSLQCTDTQYWVPLKAHATPKERAARERQIRMSIEKDFEFMTYGKILGKLREILGRDPYISTDDDDTREAEEDERERQAINEYFGDRLIIVDEIQNIRSGTDESQKRAPQLLEKIVRLSKGLKLLFMSATPMFDNRTEMIYILNLLRMNEGKERISTSDIFTSRGVNRAALMEAARGYVSFVRGADPVKFPEHLKPDRCPIQWIRENNPVYLPRPKNQAPVRTIQDGIMRQESPLLSEADWIQFNPMVACEMSEYHQEVYWNVVTSMDESRSFDIYGRQVSNIVYPKPEDTSNYESCYGSSGLERCFERKRSTGSDKDVEKYRYRDSALVTYGGSKKRIPFLDHRVVREYSVKFHQILQNIEHTPDGIIFVYHEYIPGSGIPFCLMLEQNGFQHVSSVASDGRPIITPRLEIDGRLGAEASPLPNVKAGRWNYVFLSGETTDSKKRQALVNLCNSEANRNGERVKVIVASSVASEGVDFRFIRQVHIVNPWHNFSQSDQTIGRAIRNCSHSLLPKEDRNVTVFFYSATLGRRKGLESKYTSEYESTDERIQRHAEKKDRDTKEVEFILRSIAVDCYSNREGNRYPTDQDGTRECGYGKCDEMFQCHDIPTDILPRNVNLDTYSPEFHNRRLIQKYQQWIRDLFLTYTALSLDEIYEKISTHVQAMDREIQNDILFIALDGLIQKRSQIPSPYKKNGILTFFDGKYRWTPIELSRTTYLPEFYRQEPVPQKKITETIDIKRYAKQIDNSESLFYDFVNDIADTIFDNASNPYLPDWIAYSMERLNHFVVQEWVLRWFRVFYKRIKPDDMIQEWHRVLQNYDKKLIQRVWQLMEDYMTSRRSTWNDPKNPFIIQWTDRIYFEYNQREDRLVEMEGYILDTRFVDIERIKPMIHRLLVGLISDTKGYAGYNKSVVFKIIDYPFMDKRIVLSGKDPSSLPLTRIDVYERILGITKQDVEWIHALILNEGEEDSKMNRFHVIEMKLRNNNRLRVNGVDWWHAAAFKYTKQ